MSASFFLIFVVALFVTLLVLLFLLRAYRSWIYNTFNVVFGLLLLFISFLAVETSYQSDPFIIKTTNYSKKKGYLYFFEGKGCAATIRYGYQVNANEESRMELKEDAESLSTVILLTENDRIYKVPAPDIEQRKLDIWEKELEEADECFREQIELFRRAQTYYSISIGLLLFGLLVLFVYKRKYKPNVRGVITS